MVSKKEDIFEYMCNRDDCLESYKHFITYTFYKMYKFPFMLNRHHYAMFEALEAVFKGEVNRLIINVPPRYSKTLCVSIGFPAWVYAHHPSAKFISTSYEKDLVLLNSEKVIQLMRLTAYKEMFPNTRLEKRLPAKEHWNTTNHGEYYAASTGGGITGFGAGDFYESDTCTGAVIIDDPHKVQEINSEVMRQAVINFFMDTLSSRINNKKIPFILIMQRLHEEDLSGFLLKGGSGEKWEHLCLPAIREDGKALWTYKHSLRDLQQMKAANPGMFAGQYQQNPAPEDGGVFKDEYWQWYKTDIMPHFDYKIMTVDSAQKEEEQNDYTVMQVWGRYLNRAYLIDQIRFKSEGIDIKPKFKAFYNKHKPRVCYIEDASSGTGLIQSIKREDAIPIIPVNQKRKKWDRAKDIEPYLMQKLVYLPEDQEWMSDFLYEHKIFPNGKHDDQVDNTTLGVLMTLQSSGLILYPEFNNELHIGEFEYSPEYPLIIGYSTKDNPVCIFAQYMPKLGQIRFLENLVCDSLDVRRKEEFTEQVRILHKFEYGDCKKIILLNYDGMLKTVRNNKNKENIFNWDMVFEKKHNAISIGYDLDNCLDDIVNKTAELLVNNVYSRYNNKSEKRFLIHSKCDLLIKSLQGGLTYQNEDNGFTVSKKLVEEFPHTNLGNAMHNIIYDIFLNQEAEQVSSNNQSSGIIVQAGY